MNDNKRPEADDEAYLASFESSNRKQKLIVMVVGIIVALVAAGAFYATIGSMSEKSDDIQDAFIDEGGNPENAPPTSPASEVPVDETNETLPSTLDPGSTDPAQPEGTPPETVAPSAPAPNTGSESEAPLNPPAP